MKKTFFSLLFMACSATASAIQIQPGTCTIDRLAEAQYGFCGICTEKSVSQDRTTLGAGAITYTFKVNEDLKGNIGADTFVLKQAGTPETTRWIPTYECSPDSQHEYCLMLNCSDETGFCAPLGVYCGKFDIRKEADGKRAIFGVVGRAELVKGIFERRPALKRNLSTREIETITRKEGRGFDYDDFVSIFKKLNNNRSTR